jgi:hypothetical protein
LFFDLMSLFGRLSHPLSAEEVGRYGDLGPESDDALSKTFQDMFRLGPDRKRRYQVFDEMDTYGLVSGVLDVYAEEVTQIDYDKGRAVWVESKEPHIVQAADRCLSNCQIEDRITSIVRRMCKYGDAFQRLLYSTGRGVLGWRMASASNVDRKEDKYARIVGFKEDGKKFRRQKRDVSWPWDYIHFRLLGKDEESMYGTSIIEPLFRAWRQMVLTEDALLMYRLQRAPDRNLIKIPVGDIADAKAAKITNNMRKRFRKAEYIDPASSAYRQQYNPFSPLDDIYWPYRPDQEPQVESLSGSGAMGEVYDLEHFVNAFFGAAKVPKCLRGDTKIPLLDGRVLTIEELAQKHADERFWVYSRNADGDVVPGLAHHPRVTGHVYELTRVTLDDGTFVDATEDHHFLLRSGAFRKAKDLRPGDALSPLTMRRLSTAGPDYPQVRTGGWMSSKWALVHRVVAEALFDGVRPGTGRTIHHKDEDTFNNDPANYDIKASKGAHLVEEHPQAHVLEQCWRDPAWVARKIKTQFEVGKAVQRKYPHIRKMWQKSGTAAAKAKVERGEQLHTDHHVDSLRNDMRERNRDPEFTARRVEALRQATVKQGINADAVRSLLAEDDQMREEVIAERLGCSKIVLSRRLRGEGIRLTDLRRQATANRVYALVLSNPDFNQKAVATALGITDSSLVLRLRAVGDTWTKAKERLVDTGSPCKTEVGTPNHSVVSVETIRLPKREPVYDLTVEVHHTVGIATSQADTVCDGIFVHQSYFGFEGDVNAKATLLQQDIRFARTCKRTRRAEIYGLRALLDIHFTLMGEGADKGKFDVTHSSNAYTVHATPISYLDEFERLELIRLRMEIISVLATFAPALQIDPRVWATHILLAYARLPEDLVMRLVAKSPTPDATGAGAGFEALSVGDQSAVLDNEARAERGYYSLSSQEKQILDEMFYTSPGIQRHTRAIASLLMDGDHESLVQLGASQIDPSYLPPIGPDGAAYQDEEEDDADVIALREDLDALGAV